MKFKYITVVKSYIYLFLEGDCEWLPTSWTLQLHVYPSTWKAEAVGHSKTLTTFYQPVRSHILEDDDLNNRVYL